MMTQMITQALTTLALTGLWVGGASDAPFVSGERALLNRVGTAPVARARSEYRLIDPASALLGRSAERSGFTAMPSGQPNASRAGVGAEQALLGRGA